MAFEDIAHVNRAAALGGLAAALAHELKQPLSAILTNAQAARRFVAQPSADLGQVDRALADIIEDNRRAVDLIERMRSLLKKDTGGPAVIDVNAAIDDVVRLARGAAALAHIAIDVALAPGLPSVRGDRIQLQQVVLNVTINAVEAAADAHEPPGRVRIATHAPSDREIEITVSDNGSGIDSAGLARIFEPFFTTKKDGLGVGLSISRTIVEAHGGRIRADTSPDGTIVRVTLPAMDQ